MILLGTQVHNGHRLAAQISIITCSDVHVAFTKVHADQD
jgi:hypothetical protein